MLNTLLIRLYLMVNDKYDKATEIETAADDIIDFSEGNPFGTF